MAINYFQKREMKSIEAVIRATLVILYTVIYLCVIYHSPLPHPHTLHPIPSPNNTTNSISHPITPIPIHSLHSNSTLSTHRHPLIVIPLSHPISTQHTHTHTHPTRCRPPFEAYRPPPNNYHHPPNHNWPTITTHLSPFICHHPTRTPHPSPSNYHNPLITAQL